MPVLSILRFIPNIQIVNQSMALTASCIIPLRDHIRSIASDSDRILPRSVSLVAAENRQRSAGRSVSILKYPWNICGHAALKDAEPAMDRKFSSLLRELLSVEGALLGRPLGWDYMPDEGKSIQ